MNEELNVLDRATVDLAKIYDYLDAEVKSFADAGKFKFNVKTGSTLFVQSLARREAELQEFDLATIVRSSLRDGISYLEEMLSKEVEESPLAEADKGLRF